MFFLYYITGHLPHYVWGAAKKHPYVQTLEPYLPAAALHNEGVLTTLPKMKPAPPPSKG